MLLEEFRTDWDPNSTANSDGYPLPDAEVSWHDWLAEKFPQVCTAPFAARHLRLWNWFETITRGEYKSPRVEVWPRGGAKSTTTELGVVRTGVKLSRRYVLYVSRTQDQADKHVGSIATYMNSAGIERAVNMYGHSKGWRRQELRTANGFNVSSLGLDAASRGIKLDNYRPDLIVFDDIDSQDDSAQIVDKNINSITTSIIPAGSSDCLYLTVQNLVHENGIVAQLVDGTADFLHDREKAYVEPAVHDLVAKQVEENGKLLWKVISGTPTWEGQNLEVVQQQINRWGMRAFLKEAQHEVRGASGYFFDTTAIKYCPLSSVPAGLRYCRAWDLAATEDGGDWTVGVLMGVKGIFPNIVVYIVDIIRQQWESDKVRNLIRDTAKLDGPTVHVRLTQDPAQAGKAQAQQFKVLLRGFPLTILPASGSKAVRARGLAAVVNAGNMIIARPSDVAKLHNIKQFVEVFRKFKDGVESQADDDVDAGSDAYNTLAPPPSGPVRPANRASAATKLKW